MVFVSQVWLLGIMSLVFISCGDPPGSDYATLDPEEEHPGDSKDLPTLKLGSFTLKTQKPSVGAPDSASELIFNLKPDTDFLYAYEEFGKKILSKIPVLGAYESGITLPYRERSFGGDKDGTNKLLVLEFALIRRQIASCVSIEPGFLLYREGDHIEGITSINKVPDLISKVSIFTDLSLYKQVHHKHLSAVRWGEVRRQLGDKNLKFIGLVELEIKYCQNPNQLNQEGTITIKNAILRLRPS